MTTFLHNKRTKGFPMKRIAILTSILALTACGGGSGGSSSHATFRPSAVVTPDMVNDGSSELARKFKTIEYVESNLGSLIDNGELQGAPVSSGRSATTDKMNSGSLTVSDLDARYEEALKYFDIMKKVTNADADDAESNNITNKDIKIAYSLSANKPYDEITKYDLPNIDVDTESESDNIDPNTFFQSTQISINDKIESNINLKDSVTQDIAEDIPVLADGETVDPNASLINSNLLGNLSDIHDIGNMFEDFTFTIEDGVISGAVVGDEESSFDLKRVDKTSVFKSDHKIWFFNFVVCDQDNSCRERSLEGLDEKIEDRTTLAGLVATELERDDYDNVAAAEKQNIVSTIISDPTFGEWEGAIFRGDMHSLGKMNGLQYSDFGYYTLDDYYFTFTYEGGMNDKKVAVVIPETGETVFKGTAAGQLQQNLSIDGVDQVDLEDNNKPIITNTNAATLTLKNGKETINMPFNNWYTVTVAKSGDHIKTVDFADENGVVTSQWQVNNLHIDYDTLGGSDWVHDGKPETTYNFGDGHHIQTTMTTAYYGDNGVSSEATGFVNHVDEFEDEHTFRQVWFSSVFGGTRQPDNQD